ncbi:MAG: replication protein [Fimbriimonadaceae bacterium]|nr:replication protein [Fimbriimonadaceae bacterium]
MNKPRQYRFIVGTTPFPNFLLDRVMPRLTDTEWRIICIIVRQTYGWSIGSGIRKGSDWLSHFQFKRKTGRQSAAISRAIDVLVRSGLIAVRDRHGYGLYTPAARRRSHSHLNFALHPQVATPKFQKRFALARFRSSEYVNNKRNFDKRKQQHSKHWKFSTGGPLDGQMSILDAEQKPNGTEAQTGS